MSEPSPEQIAAELERYADEMMHHITISRRPSVLLKAAALLRLPRVSVEDCCLDCGAPYVEFPLDMTLPDEEWRLIHPTEHGVLCACCIVRRASKLHAVVAIRARIEFRATAPEEP